MTSGQLTREQLLAQLEDLLRTEPNQAALIEGKPDGLSWLGRASAILDRWDRVQAIRTRVALSQITSFYGFNQGYKDLMLELHEARNDLMMGTVGPTNTVLPHGGVFDYFDEIRKTIELASKEVFFVDPYLDAEFVSRFLPHVRDGVRIHLLTTDKRLSSLLSAVDVFAKQNTVAIGVRSAPGLHDRYLFVDQRDCYQSGSSFKDGAKKAPTTLTQITDAFRAVFDTYDRIWAAAKVER